MRWNIPTYKCEKHGKYSLFIGLRTAPRDDAPIVRICEHCLAEMILEKFPEIIVEVSKQESSDAAL